MKHHREILSYRKCIKCGLIYTIKDNDEIDTCPNCGGEGDFLVLHNYFFCETQGQRVHLGLCELRRKHRTTHGCLTCKTFKIKMKQQNIEAEDIPESGSILEKKTIKKTTKKPESITGNTGCNDCLPYDDKGITGTCSSTPDKKRTRRTKAQMEVFRKEQLETPKKSRKPRSTNKSKGIKIGRTTNERC